MRHSRRGDVGPAVDLVDGRVGVLQLGPGSKRRMDLFRTVVFVGEEELCLF